MPTLRLTGVEGYTDAQIREFMDEATKLAVRVLKAPIEGVIVHVELLPANAYMRGGKTVAEIRAGANRR